MNSNHEVLSERLYSCNRLLSIAIIENNGMTLTAEEVIYLNNLLGETIKLVRQIEELIDEQHSVLVVCSGHLCDKHESFPVGLSQCSICKCMTWTLNGLCGKCGGKK